MTVIAEQIGQFYLGEEVYPDQQPLLYDAADLTTHAVIIGMTGSGKTGLGVCLLEEAALDHIPVIAVDPKGDLGNLALNFPNLVASDFEPWADKTSLTQQGISAKDWAEQTAQTWQQGIEGSGQSKDRMQQLKQSNPVTIYTPGSQAGVSLSLLANLSPPSAEISTDLEAYGQYLDATAAALLSLLGFDNDSLSAEHIFFTHLLRHYWAQNKIIALSELIIAMQNPPFERVGMLPVEQILSTKDRQKLAMQLNNLLASPSFASWLQGRPLDSQSLLYDENNTPQTSVLNIAHLSDSERMFFMTLFLNNLINWMRGQPGTGTLRAILYIDELFGYLPPTANPPSKALLLTLLKQARSYGLGLVLSTQNPIDLDYTALSNAGTWFIGRLQTAQDRARVSEGLLSADNDGIQKDTLDDWLDQLGKRKFLMHNIHEQTPCIFSTRWAMSYLAGPLTREQLQHLKPSNEHISANGDMSSFDGAVNLPANLPATLPSGIATYYFPVARQNNQQNTGHAISYHPELLGVANVFFNHHQSDSREQQQLVISVAIEDGQVAWDTSSTVALQLKQLLTAPQQPCEHQALASEFSQQNTWQALEKAFKNHIRQQHTLTLLYCETLDVYAEPGESEMAFRQRLLPLAHEKRDTEMMALRQKFAKKQMVLNKQLLTAESAVERESAQASQSWLDAGMSIGSAVVGAFMGRKVLSKTNLNKVSSAMRRAGKVSKERKDVQFAEEKYALVEEQIAALNTELQQALTQLQNDYNALTLPIESIEVQSKSSDIDVLQVALAYRAL